MQSGMDKVEKINTNPLKDPQLVEYFKFDKWAYDLRSCILRRNVEFELDEIPVNMVEIIKILNNHSHKYK